MRMRDSNSTAAAVAARRLTASLTGSKKDESRAVRVRVRVLRPTQPRRRRLGLVGSAEADSWQGPPRLPVALPRTVMHLSLPHGCTCSLPRPVTAARVLAPRPFIPPLWSDWLPSHIHIWCCVSRAKTMHYCSCSATDLVHLFLVSPFLIRLTIEHIDSICGFVCLSLLARQHSMPSFCSLDGNPY